MDYRNESPVVDLSVKKHLSPSLTPSQLSNSHSVPIHVNVPQMERAQDLSAKGVPYFIPPFDPLRFPHFGFPPAVTGFNLLKTCDKPVEVNGERSTKKAERKSGPSEVERKIVAPETERKPGVPDAEMDSPERRRSLRPRTEVKYNVSPIPLLPEEVYALNGGYTNGVGTDSDDDDDDSKPLPLLPLPKEIPPDELRQREKLIRKLQAELRQEEMLLYLLRRLKQSQFVTPPTPEATKETVTVKELPKVSPSISNHTFLPLGGISSQPSRIGSVDISPVPMKSSNFAPKSGVPAPSPLANFSKVAVGSATPPSRAPVYRRLWKVFGFKDELPAGLFITPKGPSTTNAGSRSARATPPVTPGEERMNKFPASNLNVSSTPSAKPEDPQTAAQRQAAAKLALRKQLEKTLLQIPPPKPPPPEMHFIPNPNNTEFVYLLGLETVVDHLLPGNRKQDRPAPPPTPFVCSQCKTDFSPVWKWDKKAASDNPSVMCDQCVSSSVKRALRAEHTARLKSAFMRAVQQEQELEQHSARLEQPSTPPVREPPPPPSPRPSPLASPSPSVAAANRERERMREREMREKAREERQRERIERESRERSRAMMDPHMMSPSDFSKLMDPTKMFNHQAMAALQAAQQMILRAGMGMGSPQQLQAQAAANPLLNPFNPLLYPYQLLAASAAQVQGGKNTHQHQLPAMNPAALAELQRQILLEMIPTSLGHMPGASQPSTSRQSGKDRPRK